MSPRDVPPIPPGGLPSALAAVAALDEAALGRPWTWRDRPMDVRYALYRTLEEAQAAQVAASAEPHPESRRVLALAQRAFGDLRGLLAGLPGDLLDAAPGAGQWSVRQTLGHMLLVERRYRLQTLYAIERSDQEPVRIPADRLAATAELDPGGDADQLLARLAEERAETDGRLGAVAPGAMTRPTVWAEHEVDVRFRLHRFAPHLEEHTIQCEKALESLGWRPAEGRRIARRLSALLGEIEGLGAPAAARGVEARLAERVASLPGPAGGAAPPSPR